MTDQPLAPPCLVLPVIAQGEKLTGGAKSAIAPKTPPGNFFPMNA